MVRDILYYSASARTSGNFGDDLMKAGRMDIALQIVISAFFISHNMRDNVRLHLIFNGQPDPPKHIEIFPEKVIEGDNKKEGFISKKDVAGLIKRLLYKYKPGIKNEVMKGYFIEKKSFIDVLKELGEQKRTIYILDKKGEDIRKIDISENPVFIIGDHEGIPKQEMKRLKKLEIKKVSVGDITYFATQTLTIVHNELDRRGIE